MNGAADNKKHDYLLLFLKLAFIAAMAFSFSKF